MPAWRDFQESAASFYRSLGLVAETDVTLDGVRGRHDIDVTVRGARAGVEFLWIIECKLWRRRVPKSAVATLSSIVQDVGADRGIMLSNSGFQTGAPSLAYMSNVTLTSLETLQADSYHEFFEYQCTLNARRCQAIIDAVHNSDLYERIPGGRLTTFDRPSLGFGARAAVLKTAIDEALAGNWPVTVINFTNDVQRHAKADNPSAFLDISEYAVAKLETDFTQAIDRFGSRTIVGSK
ncbi:restriction endonuclease [Nocardia sp. NPDC127606]|uniref:restriction endonuclease n=1 Tax=Nocardia sp. NPDC127606 TaxID=3345406 RepID=UPI00362EDF04